MTPPLRLPPGHTPAPDALIPPDSTGVGRAFICAGLALALFLHAPARADLAPSNSSPSTSPTPVLSPIPTPTGIRWHPDSGRVDARIPGWPLSRVLARLGRATGWIVYVEPGTDRSIRTTFPPLHASDAIPRLLGGLSYTLLPGPGGAQRLLVFQTSEGSATLAIGSEHADRIPDELIVALKKGGRSKADELAAQLGATIAGRSDKLGLLKLKFSSEEAAAAALQSLESNPDVASAEYNLRFDNPGPAGAYDAARNNSPELTLRARVVGDKDRLIVGLIDTAVQSLGPAYDAFVLPQITVGTGEASSTSLLHGSAMAGTILQGHAWTSTDAAGSPLRILPVDVYGASESSSTFEVALGVKRAIDAGATILNLSLGTSEDSPYLHTLIRDITAQGALVFAAPGNQPVTTPSFPAAYPEVVAVTAADRSGKLAPYANRGAFVDAMAPGASVVPYDGRRWLINGTSVATAYASGVAAGLVGQPGMTPAKVIEDIRRNLPAPAGLGAGGNAVP